MFNNPLIAAILDILRNSEHAIKEYDLIQMLEKSGIELCAADLSHDVALFRKHFLVMNALYSLQNSFFEEGLYLLVDPLSIKLDIISDATAQSKLSNQSDVKLKQYYLDWQHYSNTSQQDVQDLLTGFWQKYYAVDKKLAALNVLQLESIASFSEVKQSYRRLAALHHPDKGGRQDDFIQIREAYEVLKCCF